MAEKEKEQELWKMRHSAEHVLTMAMVKLFDGIKMVMGPATDEGFYFDFEAPEGVKISESDFPRIETEMAKIVSQDLEFQEEEVTAGKAREMFEGNEYKREWLDEIEERGEKVTIYWTGEEFVDLCAGPHVASTGKIGAFKLLSVAGAYWRGDEKNKMLTRIYGTAFPSQEELDKYLKNREEAEKRNHRKIGKELKLFAIYPEIGQGLPVWLPKGYAMRRALEDYMIALERESGYEHVLTPHISKDELFKCSGHLGFYDESMYSPIEIEGEKYYLKPMNCPAAMVVFRSEPRSYRDLPIKMGELGTVYRYEKSGELHGLQRVRGFTQNDAHIYCRKEHLTGEIEAVLKMMEVFYKAVGFDKYYYVLATSDPDKDKFKACGTREGWEWAEGVLREVLEKQEVEYKEAPGDAAFYGPKVDVMAVNVFGKADAISTVQIDFNLPERFGLSYINEKGEDEEPVVVHRALVGSFERFFAFLIEHYGGAFPVWLSPVQVKVLSITDEQSEYATEIFEKLRKAGIRAELDGRNETLGAKIRDAQMMKVPYMAIVGKKEADSGKIAVRTREGEDRGEQEIDRFSELIKAKIGSKSLEL